MDCIEFRNITSGFLEHRLSDEELNAYLQHYSECPKCAEDLEISYIVLRGIDLLDQENVSYDITGSYRESIRDNIRYIKRKKILIRLTFIADTLSFWAILFSLILLARIFFW